MKYTLGEAAKATGKSKTALHRAIKSGKFSAPKNESGEYEIDPAELSRLYPLVTPEPLKGNDSEQTVTGSGTEVLQAKIEGMEQQINLLRDERNDLRRRLDEDSVERRRLTLLLTDRSTVSERSASEAPVSESTPQPTKTFWRRLIG